MEDSYDNLDFIKLGYLPACGHFPVAFWVNPRVELCQNDKNQLILFHGVFLSMLSAALSQSLTDRVLEERSIN